MNSKELTSSKNIFYSLLRCPVTGSELKFQSINEGSTYNISSELMNCDGLLWSRDNLVYPIIDGIPRLLPEAMIDYELLLANYIPDFLKYKKSLPAEYIKIIQDCYRKNKRTKESFHFEWSYFKHGEDKTWNADKDFMLSRFLKETDEDLLSLKDKYILDVGCGNGMLDQYLGDSGAYVIAIDLSKSIEDASNAVNSFNVLFVQGDLQHPPVAKECFDIVQCSGVLIHTENTEKSFFTIEETVKKGGKFSVWLYHPRKDFIHNFLNNLRKVSSRLPLKLQFYLYVLTMFPISFIIKKLKGSKQNRREMMVDILDWFTPQYRWEHTHEEVNEWFKEAGYKDIKLTSNELFGFNTTGIKN